MANISQEARSSSLGLNSKIEIFLKIVFWVVPFIFAAGIWYSNSTATTAAVQKNEKSIQALDREVTSHAMTVAHPVTKSKLDTIESDIHEIKVEQRAMRIEQNRSTSNLSAICQATGASCR